MVIAPNYRGSSGYGRDFRLANRFVLGQKDLQDVVCAADYLVEQGLAQRRKIGVFGESYGGYLAVCALSRFPEYWGAGVAMVPFMNWFTEIENERIDLRTWDLENMGDPKRDYDRFRNASPIFFLENIVAPLQIVAAARDPRCPVSETLQARDRLQQLNRIFNVLVYEDEGHEFRRLSNRIDAYKKISMFLEMYLSSS